MRTPKVLLPTRPAPTVPRSSTTEKADTPSLGQGAFVNWDVIGGAVDRLGPGTFDFYPATTSTSMVVAVRHAR